MEDMKVCQLPLKKLLTAIELFPHKPELVILNCKFISI